MLPRLNEEQHDQDDFDGLSHEAEPVVERLREDCKVTDDRNRGIDDQDPTDLVFPVFQLREQIETNGQRDEAKPVQDQKELTLEANKQVDQACQQCEADDAF